ncbi:MAG: hypothetical protein HZB70_02610 [Candidatus Berkelbacteria bacterium]|nr:MAG: hypothetical protein HZB70_02610 [Candidatus Berkelbacteria bacterium]QQG51802.1 MAG: hypothetical protein HY845_00385 [Candidatus Berkelbacteria bacterium]
MPKTSLGKWSVTLAIAFFVFVAVQVLFVTSGERGGEEFFDNWSLAVTGLGAAASAVAAFICGVIALVKGERSVAVYIAIIVGAFMLVFLLGEIWTEH